MAPPTVRVDDQVWQELQRRAQPFVDSPNDVLRRTFGLSVPARPSGSQNQNTSKSVIEGSRRSGGTGRKGRALPGTILAQAEYRRPILEVLARMGGEGLMTDVLEEVYLLVKRRLNSLDHELVPSGAGVRWRIQSMYQRKQMIRDGLLEANSPKGTWRLTKSGWAASGRRAENA